MRQRIVLSIMIFLAIILSNILLFLLKGLVEIEAQLRYYKDDGTITYSGICEPEGRFELFYELFSPTSIYGKLSYWLPTLAYFCGFIISAIPSGIIADKFGGKYVLMTAVSFAALFLLVTPLAISMLGYLSLFLLSFLTGVSTGIAIPASYTLLAHWSPLKERSLLCGLALGAYIAVMIFGYYINIQTNHLNHLYGIIFYCIGILAILWVFSFYFLCSNDPYSHRSIRQKEKEYLLNELKTTKYRRKLIIPWIAIFKNRETQGYITALFLYAWSIGIIIYGLLQLDKLKESVDRSTEHDFIIALWCFWLISIITCLIIDLGLFKIFKSINNIRSYSIYIANSLAALFLIGASKFNRNTKVSTLLCYGSLGISYINLILTPLDVTQNFTGTFSSITYSFGQFAILFTITTSNAFDDGFPEDNWNLIFWSASISLLISAFIYGLLVYNERQIWDPIVEENQ
ncbi:sialin-like isoform X1 [Teleopsis dalmanni]|uniref:sialin-like isoform X1 n=1 Tax=Teleopsis dalmanni TaxID=139649 RepID=UPI0018CFDDFE|nr:sialin-like isoform X1 [Teleopsis dalmanni]XP_037927696.1 sialin-like isoform X1 [Teleopsis dalmanni]XP_037927697.1 sialin-like isoform X1 [Teleopsis dalmanni]